MKKINAMLIAAVATSLILVAGCYDGGPAMPEVVGYDGYVDLGWAEFALAHYDDAMDNFQLAIDIDISKPDAYLGAGWCSILLSDYWVVGNQYDYMAVQLDGGTWPVDLETEILTQDKDWTVFQCVDPVLTANDIMVIGAWGDSLLIVEGDTLLDYAVDSTTVDNIIIGDWLYGEYANVRFQYTFELDHPNVLALFTVANEFSLQTCSVDSIVNGTTSTVYLSVPYFRVSSGEEDFRTWCMYQNNMSFEYATYTSAGGSTSFSSDAVAAYGILQDARGENGNVHFGVASLIGLANEGPYTFSYYTSITSLKLKGMAAAMSFKNQDFRFALGICRSENFGLSIEVTDPNFLVELMQAIEMMLE